jgi:hypothetical protein
MNSDSHPLAAEVAASQVGSCESASTTVELCACRLTVAAPSELGTACTPPKSDFASL